MLMTKLYITITNSGVLIIIKWYQWCICSYL